MDLATFAIILSGISCVVSVINSLRGGKKDSVSDEARRVEFNTEMKVEMRHIRGDLEEIKTAVKRTEENSDKTLAELKKSFKDSIANIYDRLDDHLRNEHNLTVPKRKP